MNFSPAKMDEREICNSIEMMKNEKFSLFKSQIELNLKCNLEWMKLIFHFYYESQLSFKFHKTKRNCNFISREIFPEEFVSTQRFSSCQVLSTIIINHSLNISTNVIVTYIADIFKFKSIKKIFSRFLFRL